MDYPDDYLSLSFSVPLDKGIEDSENEIGCTSYVQRTPERGFMITY